MTKVSLLSLQTYVYFLADDFVKAAQSGKEAQALFTALSDSQKQRVQMSFNLSQQTVQDMGEWAKTPIQCKPTVLQVKRERERSTPLVKRFKVRTRQNVVLQIETTDQRLAAHIVENNAWGIAPGSEAQGDKVSARFGVEKEVVMVIAPELLRETAQVALKISSPQIPNFVAQVPVEIKEAAAEK